MGHTCLFLADLPHFIFISLVDINKPCERADLLQLCHSKAKCMSAGLGEGLFYCKCIPGYSGNGAVCKKIKKSKGRLMWKT